MNETAALGNEKKQQILRQRAVLLAQEPQCRDQEEQGLEIVEFLLANEHYAIESSCIGEVYPLKEFTPLPGTPAYVLGLVNLRGKILSVIDLRKFFDLADKGLSDLNKIIVLRDEVMEFGILADAVLAARQIRLNLVSPSLPTLTEVRNEYLKGVTEERLVLLDGVKLLADRKLRIHEEL